MKNKELVVLARKGGKAMTLVDDLLAEISNLEQQLKDEKERIDYIENEWFYRSQDGTLSFGFIEDTSWGPAGVTLRQAIDAERAKGGV